jgi:hypothetical protein
MERRFILTEEEKKDIRKKYFFEQSTEKTEKRFATKVIPSL